jgi:hypothetical protein
MKVMAGEWIKLRCDLAEDPAVILIAATLHMDSDAVVGKLARLWSWASNQTTNGDARSVTDLWIDHFLGTPGFSSAMQSAGWLRIDSGGIVFPKFDRHNSQSAKGRALAARRMQAQRRKKRDAASVTEAQPEKRREEKNNTPPCIPPSRGELPPRAARRHAASRGETVEQRIERIKRERAACTEEAAPTEEQ